MCRSSTTTSSTPPLSTTGTGWTPLCAWLVINPGSGLLEFNPDGTGGIVVGTRTAYVPGLFMVDKAVEEYRRVLREELKGLEELMG